MDDQETIDKLVAAMREDESLIDQTQTDPAGLVARIADVELEAEAAAELCEDAVIQIAAEALGDSMQTLSDNAMLPGLL